MSVAAAERQFHVLAVDDSLTDRKLIERLLRNSSYQVTTVDSGSKALELLGLLGEQAGCPSVSSYQQEIEVNLIITDYCMPGMTGYDLLKKIKESKSKRDIPVVIMSSEYTPSRINRCLEGGAEEFFMKPVQLSDMKKLRPYILKGKSHDNKESFGQLQPESQSQPQPQPQPQPQSQPQLDLQKQSNFIGSVTTSICSNKRKAVDEGHSPQRTRARYTNPDNLTMV